MQMTGRSIVHGRPCRARWGVRRALVSTRRRRPTLHRRVDHFLVTGGPLQEQGVLRAIEQPTLVLESETKDFGGFQFRPDRFVEAVLVIVALASLKNHVAAVLLVAVEPHPLVLAS